MTLFIALASLSCFALLCIAHNPVFFPLPTVFVAHDTSVRRSFLLLFAPDLYFLPLLAVHDACPLFIFLMNHCYVVGLRR